MEKNTNKDETGYPIPVPILDDWKRADEFGRCWLAKLDGVIKEVSEGLERGDLAFAEIHESTVSDLIHFRHELERVVPYAVCPTCQGQLRDRCTTCKRRGFISKWMWEICIPIETREMRRKVVERCQ